MLDATVFIPMSSRAVSPHKHATIAHARNSAAALRLHLHLYAPPPSRSVLVVESQQACNHHSPSTAQACESQCMHLLNGVDAMYVDMQSNRSVCHRIMMMARSEGTPAQHTH